MKLDTNSFQGKTPSLEEGPLKYQNSNGYIVLDRVERKANCSRFIQIVKVIFYIELIIFIGWLGCISLSKYNGDNKYKEAIPWTNNECGISGIGCNEENRRGTRSIEDIEHAREICERSVNATRRRVDSLATQVVIGETSDPIILKLREKFTELLISKTLRVIFEQSNGTLNASGPTDEEWRTFAVEIKHAIVKSTDSEHQHQLETTGPLSQEITNEIRDTVESMSRDYLNCETILPTPKSGNSKGTTQEALRLVEIVLEGERCMDSMNTMQERLRALIAQILPGDSSDPIVRKLRDDIEGILILIPESFWFGMSLEEDEPSVKARFANITNEEWHAILVNLKEDIVNSTDSQHQQQLQANGPPTQEMSNEFRSIAEYILIDYRKCNRLLTNVLPAGRFKRSNQQAFRMRRESEPVSYLKIDCFNAETQLLEERRARLEAIANEDVTSDPSNMKTKTFLDAIEAALNATNPSDVSVDDDLLQNDSGLIVWKQFMSNASLEFKKEFYELVRDEFLLLRKQRNQSAEWEGYDLLSVYQNFTYGLYMGPENANLDTVLTIIVKCGEAFNLHYLEAEKENSSDDSKRSFFGILTYLDEEPEKLGVRRMKHILNGYIRLYFRVMNILGPCDPIADRATSETPTRDRRFIRKRFATAHPIPEPITVTCWRIEQDRDLLEERRARQEAFAIENVTPGPYEDLVGSDQYNQKKFLVAIQAALNAKSTLEIHFDNDVIDDTMVLVAIQYLAKNASLDLHKEGYELSRDLFFEMNALNNHSPEWEGYYVEKIAVNLTDAIYFSKENMTSQTIFNDFIKFGQSFNLRYDELENRNSGNESNKRVFGKFTYVGQEPEKLGVRHLRHILDGFVKFHYKTQNPSTLEVCNSNKHSIKKRSVTADSIPEPTTAKCWSKEQDPILLEERRTRLEDFAVKNAVKNAQNLFTQNFLGGVEAALNATSTSEIHFDDKLIKSALLLSFVEFLVTNSSLELQKEGYEFARDLYLEMLELNDRSPEWEGFDVDTIVANITSRRIFYIVNMTSESIFNEFIRFGQIFNLRYDAFKSRESGDDTNKPVIGKFTYLGDEPEKLGIRHIRHILDNFVKIYFKTQKPSTPDPLSEPTTATHWSKEQDTVLLAERRARLEAFANKTAIDRRHDSYTQVYLEGIEAALNATSTSEFYIDHESIGYSPILLLVEYLATNSSLELHKEGYEFARDLYLEILEMKDRSSEWEGYDSDSMVAHLTDRNIFSRTNMTSQTIFDDVVKFGQAFNLRYDKLESTDIGDEANKPVFGKFTYLGEEPEKLGIRHMRHILDSFVKFYFKTQNPSPDVCNSGMQPRVEGGEDETSTQAKRSVEKRSVNADPVAEPTTADCWSKEQDTVLLEERRARVEAFANKNATADGLNAYTHDYLEAIEAALNATSTSEIHFDEKLITSTPMLSFIEYLAANSSLELQKEGYEFARDLYLEMLGLRDHSSDWEGFDEDSIAANISQRMIFSRANMSSQTIFDDFIKFGQTFNLGYHELQNRDNGDEENKPVFGKFTYLGEEPEKLGIRHLRHLLDSFIKFYFRTQNPSTLGVCNWIVQPRAEGGEAETPTRAMRSVEKPDQASDQNVACWTEEPNTALLEERRVRLDALAQENANGNVHLAYTRTFLEGINAALAAKSTSEIHINDEMLDTSIILSITEYLTANASLELHKEGFELARDMFLETRNLANRDPEWKGYDIVSIADNLTDSLHFSRNNMTYESIFKNFIKMAQTFNLRYMEIGNRDDGDDRDKPVFGNFTYVGEEPEKLGIRHVRHIYDALVKFYFKTKNLSISGIKCNLSEEPQTPAVVYGETLIKAKI